MALAKTLAARAARHGAWAKGDAALAEGDFPEAGRDQAQVRFDDSQE